MTTPETSTVGLKLLKENLSHYVARARAGEHIVITDRGREVAELVPLTPARRAVLRLVAGGQASWDGGKPGLAHPVRYTGPPVSAAVLEGRDAALL